MEAYISTTNIESKTDEWMRQLISFDRPTVIPKPENSALLIIDMQRYFIDENGGAFLPASRAILPGINHLLESFRKLDLPVIFTRHAHKMCDAEMEIMGLWWNELITEGSRESEIGPHLKPNENDIIITKNRYSAFFGTDLEKLLSSMKVSSLFITGVMTNLCCESTARDAFFRNFQVFFIPDATATVSEEMHFASLLNLAYGFARIIPTWRALKFL